MAWGWVPAGPDCSGPAGYRSHVFDGRRLAAGQVDAQLLRGPEDLVVGVAQLDRLPVAGQHLDVEAERLQLLEQHLERLRDARLGDVLALDDGLVDLHAAQDVVGLDGEQLLDRKSTRLNSSHANISYAVFCLKKKKKT